MLAEPAGVGGLGIDVAAVLVGVLVDGEDAQVFDELHLGLENLAAFAGQTSLHPGRDGIWLTMAPVEPVSASHQELTVSIVWRPFRGGQLTRSGQTFSFGEAVVFEARSNTAISVNEWRSVSRRLQDLMTFASGEASAITFWNVRSSGTPGEPVSGRRVFARLHEPRIVAPRPDDHAVVPARLVLRLDDVPWQTLLSNWFESYDEFRPILGTRGTVTSQGSSSRIKRCTS